MRGLWLAAGIIVLIAIAIMCAGCVLTNESARDKIDALNARRDAILAEIEETQKLIDEGKLTPQEGAKRVKIFAAEAEALLADMKKIADEEGIPWWQVAGLFALNAAAFIFGGTKYVAIKSALVDLLGSVHAARCEGEDAETVVTYAVSKDNKTLNAEAEKLPRVIPYK